MKKMNTQEAAFQWRNRGSHGYGVAKRHTVSRGIVQIFALMLLMLGSLFAHPKSAFANDYPLSISLEHIDEGDVVCVATGKHAFRATVTRQDNDEPASGRTVTFSSSKGACNPPAATTDANGHAETTLEEVAEPGTMTVTASVSWDASAARGTPAGTANASLDMYAIGGLITGDSSARYECRNDSQHRTVQAAPNQPDGTSYTWSTSSSGQGSVGFVDPQTSTDIGAWSGTGATYSTLTFRGTSGSMPRNDVKIKVTYTLHNFSCESEYSVTVLRPASTGTHAQGAANQFAYPNQNGWYGFAGQWIRWRLFDQFGDGFGAEIVTETWTTPVSLIANMRQPFIGNGIAWQTLDQPGTPMHGVFHADDIFLYTGLGQDAAGNDLLNLTAPGQTNCFTSTHGFRAGDANPTIGCVVGTYNTTWSNRGVTGH